MAGDLVSIGAVSVDYRRPSLRWTSNPTQHGVRTASITGAVDSPAAQTLSELVDNHTDRETIYGFTGVKEYLVFSGDRLENKTGWYVLMSFDEQIEREFMFGTVGQRFTQFSLSCAYLGDQA